MDLAMVFPADFVPSYRISICYVTTRYASEEAVSEMGFFLS